MNLSWLPGLESRVWDALQKSTRSDLPCLFCNVLTRSRGAYFRGEKESFPAPHAKARVVIYPLCNGHGDRKDISAWVGAVVQEKSGEGWKYV